MLKSMKTVNLKDLRESQENEMRKNPSENITLNANDCCSEEFSNALLNMKRKGGTVQRCYGNDIKKRRKQTSEDHVFKVSIHDPQYVFLTVSTEFQIVITVCSYFISVFYFYFFMFYTFTAVFIYSIKFFILYPVVNQRIHSF
jgi:hypothetical protein